MKQRKKSNGRVFWYLHPHLSLAVGLILANIAIIFLFTGILSLTSGESFIDELKTCFILTLAADGIYETKDVIELVLKSIMILLQMVIFSGALIGFMTNILENLFDKAMNHRGTLKLKNHYVLLGWSSLGANIIYDMSFMDGKKTVVILSDKDRDEIDSEIQNLFTLNNRKIKDINIIIKNGEPGNAKHLTDVSIADAKSIGILLVHDNENEENAADLNTFKLLMSIIHLVHNTNIVVEVTTQQMKEKIEALFKDSSISSNQVSVFSSNVVTGHIVGKSIINQQYFYVFHELLGYDGVEFYDIEPMRLSEALEWYDNCIPMANYDDDNEIDENGQKEADHLYVLGEDSTCNHKRQERKVIDRRIPFRRSILDKSFTVFIVGENQGLKFLVQEFKEYEENSKNKINIKTYRFSDDLSKIVSDINNTQGKRKLLLLSDKKLEAAEQDSNIYMTLLSLKLSHKLDEDVEISIEISNPNNIQSLNNLGITKVIVTNKIISLYMIQLLTHENAVKFYQDVITPDTDENDGSVDVEIYDSAELLDVSKPLVFNSKAELIQSFYYSSNQTMMLFAIRNKKDNSDAYYLCNDIDKEERIVIDENTELFIMTCPSEE